MERKKCILLVFSMVCVSTLILHFLMTSRQPTKNAASGENGLRLILNEMNHKLKELSNQLTHRLQTRDTERTVRTSEAGVLSPQQNGGIQTTKIASGKCTVIDVRKVEKTDFNCVPMHTGKGDTPICIYDPKIDVFISKHLLQGTRWEEGLCVLMEKLFDKYNDLHLLDLGANLGIYSLTALKYDRKVVAVDPNIDNLRRIRTSVQKGKLTLNSITLVHNAISDKYERIQLMRNDINVGGRGIVPAKSDVNSANAVYMDDLIDLVTFKRALLKLDIETAEARAMSHASKMFDTVDIPIVLMEWNYAKKEPGGTNMRQFFEERGYSPYNSPINGKLLTGDHQKWTWDVFWIRTKDVKFPALKI